MRKNTEGGTLAMSPLFTRSACGIWALSEWNLPFYKRPSSGGLVYQTLKDNRYPMQYKELVKKLVETGQMALNTLYRWLKKDLRIEKITRGKYGLREWRIAKID